MATVAELLGRRHAKWCWLIFIEGCALAFTTDQAIAGSGPSSWIGVDHGEREVLLGLVMPNELGFGKSEPFEGEIQEASPTVKLLDFDGRIVALFKDDEDDDILDDSLGARLSPLDDPAPATIPGPNQLPVDLWDRNVGIERIGPSGQRSWFWIWPEDEPAGHDHPIAPGLPLLKITDEPTIWAGRKVAIYSIVYDPETETWPSWDDQHDGGALRWCGTLRDVGSWSKLTHLGGQTRALDINLSSPRSWLAKSLNSNRPAKWVRAQPGLEISVEKGNHLVAFWMGIYHEGPVGTFAWTSQSIASGNTLAGLTTREEVIAKLNAIIQCALTDTDQGTVLAASNVDLGAPNPWAADSEPDEDIYPNYRDVDLILLNGVATLRIKMGTGSSNWGDVTYPGFWANLLLHTDVWAALGFDPAGQEHFWEDGAAAQIGGPDWGEAAGADILPNLQYVFFSAHTGDPGFGYSGNYKSWPAAWAHGTVTFHDEGGDIVFLSTGDFPCEGQLAQAYVVGDEIDGTLCDSAGWWVFRGVRYTEADWANETEPAEFAAVALCEWVSTDDGLRILQNNDGTAQLRVVRWEDPRRFHLPFPRFTGTWVSSVETLECTPIGVIGGTLLDFPDKAHWLPVRMMLSSGTSEFAELGPFVAASPGTQHPPDQPPVDKLAGDLEKRDLALGLPLAAVDYKSFRRAAQKLGQANALNRSMHVLHGPERADQVLKGIFKARMWAWSWKKLAGEAVHSFGALDVISPLALSDVEVTISDDDKGSTIDDLDFEPHVALRDGGPYDSFKLSGGRNFIEDELGYEIDYISNDQGRRFRHGRLEWAMEDPGLANPRLFQEPGDPQIYDWSEAARSRYSDKAGKFWARRSMVYTTVVDPIVALSIGLGTIVRVVDQRAETPQGVRGLDHLGWVCEAFLITSGKFAGCMRLSVFLQPWPVGSKRVWAPFARCYNYNTGTSLLTCSEDIAGVGSLKPGFRDVAGFVEPEESDVGGGVAQVCIFQSEDGVDYPAAFEVRADAIAVDLVANTITLDNVTGPIYADMIKWVFLDKHSNQTADWVIGRFAPNTDSDGYRAPGEKGWRL